MPDCVARGAAVGVAETNGASVTKRTPPSPVWALAGVAVDGASPRMMVFDEPSEMLTCVACCVAVGVAETNGASVTKRTPPSPTVACVGVGVLRRPLGVPTTASPCSNVPTGVGERVDSPMMTVFELPSVIGGCVARWVAVRVASPIKIVFELPSVTPANVACCVGVASMNGASVTMRTLPTRVGAPVGVASPMMIVFELPSVMAGCVARGAAVGVASMNGARVTKRTLPSRVGALASVAVRVASPTMIVFELPSVMAACVGAGVGELNGASVTN